MIGYHQCDVALIVPLPEEFEQIEQLAGFQHQFRIRHRTYSRLRDTPLGVWATCIGEMGNAPALQCTRDAIDTLNPRIVMCVGIGGSLHPTDLRLGEVAVSRWIADIADAAKVEDTADTYMIRTVGRPFPADEKLVGIIENLRIADCQPWKVRCAKILRKSTVADSEEARDAQWPRIQVRASRPDLYLLQNTLA